GPRAAAALVARAARAVAAAHRRGVTHQDLKPRNILVDEARQPRVIDFGLARLRHAWRDEHVPDGLVSGTIAYLSPEQARGGNSRAGPRTDVFALGAVLYYLLVGRAPFAGDGFDDSLARARQGAFDRGALRRPGVPRRLEAICLRAMAAEPEGRYATADELAADLEA